MKKLILLILGFIALFSMSKITIAQEIIDPKQYIILFAQRYQVNEDLLLDVAYCESRFNQNARGDSGKAIGIFQFWQGTWDSFSKDFGEILDINSVHDQAKLAAWAFSTGKQLHWTCFRILADPSKSLKGITIK